LVQEKFSDNSTAFSLMAPEMDQENLSVPGNNILQLALVNPHQFRAIACTVVILPFIKMWASFSRNHLEVMFPDTFRFL
jgi:hypothetical protein